VKPKNAEIAEVTVERIGARGDGIGRWNGVDVFIPFAAPGDRLRVRLGARRSGGREAEIVDRLAAGPGRTKPGCRHFGRCGGCALQHLAASAYAEAKLDSLRMALRRAGIDPAVVAPLRSVPPGRRRARLGLRRPVNPNAPAIVGFRERFRHELVDLRECAVLAPSLFALLAPLRGLAGTTLAPGTSAEVTLTDTDSGVDMLIEASHSPGLAALEALGELAAECDIARIVWRAGDDIPIVQRRPVRVVLSGVAVPLPPGGFLQASAAAEAMLVAQVTAAVGAKRPALDLFAGLGTFTFALAAGGAVHAVEGDAAAAAALATAAPAASGVTVERRDLERDPIPAATLGRYAAVVFDPPRAGSARQAAALAASPVPTIAAVSCNPATFARDARLLLDGGYRLERVVPVDQFVWTPHLELVASFRR
jgi:23S rRNA (uracil1939-C5)-methyltransferase